MSHLRHSTIRMYQNRIGSHITGLAKDPGHWWLFKHYKAKQQQISQDSSLGSLHGAAMCFEDSMCWMWNMASPTTFGVLELFDVYGSWHISCISAVIQKECQGDSTCPDVSSPRPHLPIMCVCFLHHLEYQENAAVRRTIGIPTSCGSAFVDAPSLPLLMRLWPHMVQHSLPSLVESTAAPGEDSTLESKFSAVLWHLCGLISLFLFSFSFSFVFFLSLPLIFLLLLLLLQAAVVVASYWCCCCCCWWWCWWQRDESRQ